MHGRDQGQREEDLNIERSIDLACVSGSEGTSSPTACLSPSHPPPVAGPRIEAGEGERGRAERSVVSFEACLSNVKW